MRLGELLSGVPGVLGSQDAGVSDAPADPEVASVVLDSRRAGPGSLFVAVKGARNDGSAFVTDALARGAVAVVSADPPLAVPVPWVRVEDVRDAVGRLVARLHAECFDSLPLHAVTGTKGKTTSTRMLASILTAAGRPCATVGTLGVVDARGGIAPLGNTTPDAARLAEEMVRLRASGHRAVAIEASSQAGIQARLRHLPIRSLAFTNLSPEHGELHPTLDDYRAAKARLFSDAAAVRPELAVIVPEGDSDGEAMARAAGPRARVVRFGVGPAAEVRGRIAEAGLDFLALEFETPEERCGTRLRFGGRFNLQNALAAVASAYAVGVGLEAVAAGLASLGPVPGRFQVVGRDGVFAMVDYAHSANALEALLGSCRELVVDGRILLVFGCGGEKDRTKRPRMGASAERFADLVWVTNDNPRREDPAAIATEILAGIPETARARVRVELDRRAAIEAALGEARPGDLVVVAGKGHEDYQILGERTVPFDDLAEIRRVLGVA